MRNAARFLVLVSSLGLYGGAAHAQNVGFQLNRYEPTTAGEWSFMVDHPWYNGTRNFAAGLTLNYAHNPLVFGLRSASGEFTRTDVVIRHQLLMHLDLGVALFDRLNVSFTMPVTLAERGQAIGGVGPLDSGSAGDPRLGLMVRLYGQPDESAFSVSLGGNLWIPVNVTEQHAGDRSVRLLPKVVFAGLWNFLRWSATAGFYYRQEAQVAPNLADPRGGTVGPALQIGGLLNYADKRRRFAVGPELLLLTTVTDGRAFSRDATSLQLLLGGHYNLLEQIQLGLALGLGTLRDPGTPDFRLLFRLAYAPLQKPAAPVCKDCDCSKCPKPEPVVVEKVVEKPVEKIVEKPGVCCEELKVPRPILFETGKWRILPQSDPVLADMAKQIRAKLETKDDIHVSIEGHTDDQGAPARLQDQAWYGEYQLWVQDAKEKRAAEVALWFRLWVEKWSQVPAANAKPSAEPPQVYDPTALPEDFQTSILYNQWLSEKRAEAVVQWLQNKAGIPQAALSSKGFGLTMPLEASKTKASRDKNRRVEFVVQKDGCVKRKAPESPAQQSPAQQSR